MIFCIHIQSITEVSNQVGKQHKGPRKLPKRFSGIISCFYGIAIICMDLWAPRMIADFFGNDVLQDAEEFYHKEPEDEQEEPGL